jgi:hypothetical protein
MEEVIPKCAYLIGHFSTTRMPWRATLGALALKQRTPSVEGSRLGSGNETAAL